MVTQLFHVNIPVLMPTSLHWFHYSKLKLMKNSNISFVCSVLFSGYLFCFSIAYMITWKHFLHYWPFVRGNHWSLVHCLYTFGCEWPPCHVYRMISCLHLFYIYIYMKAYCFPSYFLIFLPVWCSPFNFARNVKCKANVIYSTLIGFTHVM